jgi:hypothetical protein
VPYLASTAAAVNAPSFGGGTPNANQIARAQLWPHLLDFLATTARPREAVPLRFCDPAPGFRDARAP